MRGLPGFLGLTLLLLGSGCLNTQPAPTTSPEPSNPALGPSVEREVIRFETNNGPITILLYPEAAPRTVELMKTYVQENYYVGREFARVVPGHVIQLTDKAGGRSDDARRVPLETNAEYHFSAGAAGIARDPADPNSGGPEFFLMDYATSHLDGNFTVWGQTLDGLSVIHRCARVAAVNTGMYPVVMDYTTDWTAVDACTITKSTLVQVRLTGPEAAQLPLSVAKNVRAGDFRHSLQYPRDLRAGGPSELVWYLRPYNATQPPAEARVSIAVGSDQFSVSLERATEGAYHWLWTPKTPGLYEATFNVDGQRWATLSIPVSA